jgi:hypothetical protein
MERLMLANISAGDDELRALAIERAEAAKEFLTVREKVAPERVFIVAPKLDGGGDKDAKEKDSRVSFSLK